MPKLPYLCLRLLAKLVMYSTLREVAENLSEHLPKENERIAKLDGRQPQCISALATRFMFFFYKDQSHFLFTIKKTPPIWKPYSSSAFGDNGPKPSRGGGARSDLGPEKVRDQV